MGYSKERRAGFTPLSGTINNIYVWGVVRGSEQSIWVMICVYVHAV